jgi:hypothetical protein
VQEITSRIDDEAVGEVDRYEGGGSEMVLHLLQVGKKEAFAGERAGSLRMVWVKRDSGRSQLRSIGDT